MEIRPAAAAESVVSVLVPVAVAGTYTYRAPATAKPAMQKRLSARSHVVLGKLIPAFPGHALDDRFHEPDHGTGDLLVDSSFAVR